MPTAFVVPPSGKDDPENRFAFQIGETTYSVPKLKFVSMEAGLAFEAGDTVRGMLLAMESDAARKAFLALAEDQRDALETAWVKASRVSPGESEASAAS